MDLDNRKKCISLAICLSGDLLSRCNLLKPYDMESSESEDEGVPVKRVKVQRIENYLEVVSGMKEKQFQSHFRINRQTFEKLLPIVHDFIKKETIIGRNKMSTEKQFLAVLWILATPDSYRSVGERFDMGKSSLSSAFFRIVKVLNILAKNFIKWPTEQEITSIRNCFFNIAGINNVIGAIDGTFIPIKAPKVDPEVYITRKCNYAITLQATCDASLRFTDCYVGYPGSVSDTRIFRNSDLYKKTNENKEQFFPHDTFIVGDKAYPLLDWCIPPYFDRGNLNRAKKNFNLKISQTRQVVERSFALLFGRFRRLKYLDMNRVDFIPQTILAACVLHNVCLANNDLYIDEYMREGEVHVTGADDEEVEDVNHFVNRHIDDVMRAGHAKREYLCRTLYVED